MLQGTDKNILGVLKSADMNSTSDQAIKISSPKYIIRRVVACNASVNLTTAAGGFYTAAAKGGTAIIDNTQVYTALTASTKFVDLTLGSILGTDTRTEGTLYFSLTTAQGAAATADIYIIGDSLP